ncbi:MAG: HU family DNA-binding protein [Thermoanaerobaculia bacterium]
MGTRKQDRHDLRSGVTRADLTDAVYRRHGGLTKSEAADVVNKIFDTMKTNLLEGRPVKIQNFGVFEIASRKGRAGVNPVTGRRIFIPAHRSLQFRPAPRLKDAVQEPEGGH